LPEDATDFLKRAFTTDAHAILCFPSHNDGCWNATAPVCARSQKAEPEIADRTQKYSVGSSALDAAAVTAKKRCVAFRN
jgi:hypothetical protein